MFSMRWGFALTHGRNSPAFSKGIKMNTQAKKVVFSVTKWAADFLAHEAKKDGMIATLRAARSGLTAKEDKDMRTELYKMAGEGEARDSKKYGALKTAWSRSGAESAPAVTAKTEVKNAQAVKSLRKLASLLAAGGMDLTQKTRAMAFDLAASFEADNAE
jgi:hypothetical protein